MKLPHLFLTLSAALVCADTAPAQNRNAGAPSHKSFANVAVVVDESLSVLRTRPGLYADPIQRMRRGRRVRVVDAADADGVRFYKVVVPPSRLGWVQADAVFTRTRAADEARLFRLVHVTEGFDQLELATEFLRLYPASKLRPPMLLLYGDLLEETAAKLSRDAASRLKTREMAASGAPVYSYYLNFRMLDRYRRLGVRFLLNPSTRSFHYDGASWRELVRKHASAAEASDAQKRLDSLKLKLETQRGSRVVPGAP